MDFTNATKALTARGFKVSSFETAKEAADKLAGQIGAQVVQVIGNRFVLYRKSSRNDIEHIRLVRE